MTITITTGAQGFVPGAGDGALLNEAHPGITALSDGDYIITWINNSGVFGQIFDTNGNTVGGELQINTNTIAVGVYPATIAPLSGGGFVATWTTTPTSGFDGDIYSQRFDASGDKVGGEVMVNTISGGSGGSVVTALAGGGYLVAWASDFDNNQDIDHVYAQQFDASGNPVGGNFEANTDTTHSQAAPAIAALAGGGYVITWQTESEVSYGVWDIYEQQYSASGAKVGVETLVSTSGGTNWQTSPTATGISGGGYVVVWEGDTSSGGKDIYQQLFSSSGAKVGTPVVVNTTTSGHDFSPTVTALPNGGWFVAWSSDQSGGGVYGQTFAANGAKVGGETLETLTSGALAFPASTVLASGQVALAWATQDPSSGDWGIVQSLTGSTSVSPDLTSAIETAVGTGNDTFFAAPGTINDGDRIEGGTGSNTLELTAAQTADFTGVTLSNVQRILGSAGNDTLIFPGGPPAGVSFVTGGGNDTLAMGGMVNLSALSLSGAWTLAPAPGAFADFQLTSLSQISEISGVGGDLTVDASAFTLTSAEVSQLMSQGVSTIIEGGLTFRQSESILFTQPQTRINTASGQAVSLNVAVLANGDTVTAFQVAPPGAANGPAIYFELTDSVGNLIGTQVAVDGAATQDEYPTVAALAGGGFVIAWQGFNPSDGFASNNYLQTFDSQGNKVGGLVTLGGTTSPEVAATSDGGYIVVWNANSTVSYQRFSAEGVQTASGALGSGENPTVSSLAGGGWVGAWIATGGGVQYQVFNAAGATVGGQQTATTSASYAQNEGDRFLSSSALAGGGFVLTWTSFSLADKAQDIYAERFDANGVAQGGVFQVNTSDGAQVASPVVAATTDGGFIVSWQWETPTGTGPAVYAQLFTSSGQPVGPEYVVAAAAFGTVSDPAVAALGRGGYLVAYSQTGLGVTDIVANATVGVDGILTTGVDTFVGGNTNLFVITPAGGLNPGDVITGGTGQNELEMISAGTLDLTAPATFSGFQTIAGSSGNDTFIVSTPRLAGVTRISGDGGTNTIVATDSQLNLGSVTLVDIQALATTFAGGTIFTPPAAAGALTIAGAAGYDQVDFSGATAATSTFTHNANGSWTIGLQTGQDDVLTNVELAQFQDRDVSLVARWANRGDFLDSSVSDFLISNAAGAVVVGEAHNGVAGFSTVSGLGSEWSFRGDGDFFGDGTSDFLIQNGAGAVYVGEVKNGAEVYTQVAGLGPEWKFVGTGNYLGDARSDFLIENTAGAVVIGEVSNGQTNYTQVAALGPEWKFEGSGDFLGDGKDEFLIENTAGAVFIGEVSGGQTTFTSLAALGPEWKFVGTGDFLSEGRDQFLIENTSGLVVIGDFETGQIDFVSIGGLGPEWKFVGTGDYLGEGHDQVLIENTAGAVVIGDYAGGAIHFTQVTSLGSEWAFH